MSLNVCVDCGFEKRRCQCIIAEPLLLTEDNMVKKILKWIWNAICWPFKKVVEWLWTR